MIHKTIIICAFLCLYSCGSESEPQHIYSARELFTGNYGVQDLLQHEPPIPGRYLVGNFSQDVENDTANNVVKFKMIMRPLIAWYKPTWNGKSVKLEFMEFEIWGDTNNTFAQWSRKAMFPQYMELTTRKDYTNLYNRTRGVSSEPGIGGSLDGIAYDLTPEGDTINKRERLYSITGSY